MKMPGHSSIPIDQFVASPRQGRWGEVPRLKEGTSDLWSFHPQTGKTLHSRLSHANGRAGGRELHCGIPRPLFIFGPFREDLRETEPMSEVTEILASIDQGDPTQAEKLLPLVYRELRRLAASKLSIQAPGQTLQATALVHEAYLRLVGSGTCTWEGRGHFFAAAAEAMRHILVDRARRKQRLKHGGDLQRINIDEVEIPAAADDERFLLLHDALSKLEALDPVKAEVVKLHYFAGLTHQQTALVLKVSEKTVRRHWNFSRVWLYQAIREENSL
jgi:RNA polymerase sigma factor (TIGR02999 family)